MIRKLFFQIMYIFEVVLFTNSIYVFVAFAPLELVLWNKFKTVQKPSTPTSSTRFAKSMLTSQLTWTTRTRQARWPWTITSAMITSRPTRPRPYKASRVWPAESSWKTSWTSITEEETPSLLMKNMNLSTTWGGKDKMGYITTDIYTTFTILVGIFFPSCTGN